MNAYMPAPGARLKVGATLEVGTLKRLHAETAAEFDAILDRAFKGGL
jgi:hypothetical protein